MFLDLVRSTFVTLSKEQNKISKCNTINGILGVDEEQYISPEPLSKFSQSYPLLMSKLNNGFDPTLHR